MENNKVEKKNTGLIIILILIILGLVGYIVYDKVLVKEEEKDVVTDNENKSVVENNKSYSYADVAGYYSIEKNFYIEGQEVKGKYKLYLWNDGTFKSVYSIFAPIGYLGNYTIENNTIKLNYLFESNSGTGLYVKNGSVTFDIIDDNSISCSSLIGYSKEIDFSGTLIKAATQDEYFENHNLYEILNNEPDIDSAARRKMREASNN